MAARVVAVVDASAMLTRRAYRMAMYERSTAASDVAAWFVDRAPHPGFKTQPGTAVTLLD